MDALSKAIDMVLKKENAEVFLSCCDKDHQEAIRTKLYWHRRKLKENEKECIGVTREEIDGKLYIKVYRRKVAELYELNSAGIPVRVEVE